MARRPAQSTTIQKQLKALQRRVSVLESALKPAKLVRSEDDIERDRDRAEEKARSEALSEFYEQKKIERYLKDPRWLAVDLAFEKQEADFLRSRGLKPNPSKIPEQFRRGLRKYQPKASRP